MEFNMFIDTFIKYKGLIPEISKKKMDWQEFFKMLIQFNIEMKDGPGLNFTQVQQAWYTEKRPYYRIWPGIIPALLKVDLNRVMCHMLNLPQSLATLALYFPKGHELLTTDGRKVYACLLSRMALKTNFKKELTFDENVKYYSQHPEELTVGFMIMMDTHHDHGDFDYLKFRATEHVSVNDELNQIKGIGDMSQDLMKLIVTILLLENDPELITRDVLADDRLRYEEGDDLLRARLEDKASRRGKLGWDIGKETGAMSPHYRHPHFAIRWTGKGGAIPKLTRIKGSFVHRDKIAVTYED